ncbi:MAG: hypothetical protein NTX61_16170 [Bacteroidetes bacterium]|nr:hypothetical protein [Bacteroidota bacterium]
MTVLVEINEKSKAGRNWLRIAKISPDFARILDKSEKNKKETLKAIAEAKQGKGKSFKSVKDLMNDLNS